MKENLNSKTKIMIMILFSFVLQTVTPQCTDTPRIPAYLGRGYDIVAGNPLSNRIDPGFRN
jgi:hypothetical protein